MLFEYFNNEGLKANLIENNWKSNWLYSLFFRKIIGNHPELIFTQPVFTCSKLDMGTSDQGLYY